MKSLDAKALLATQPEKPLHYSYLKEFRVEQCPSFLQHKCTQHRPYTCFHWHFLNQRRRRPIRRKDGTFNYSPDNYCTNFDENTGICPEGDECPYLHRTAGDTERRYHLRYYKTGMCVHETDSRGVCIKNGTHCAFAHGLDDVRPPVYDLRELQGIDLGEGEINGVGPNSLDKERSMVNDDPKWQDTSYVLANYKTEQCKRPPRLCRQGYACPQYHNSKDRRRPPKKFKYRSTACPNVKHGDEWGEPANCESGDACQYCHTRTEQQFHPEIYKSTKCNDIQQNSYCPRGAFCAFAHVDQEMTQVRENASNENCTGTSLADILQSALPPDSCISTSASIGSHTESNIINSIGNSNNLVNSIDNGKSIGISDATTTNSITNCLPAPLPPIGSKPRHLSGNGLTNGIIGKDRQSMSYQGILTNNSIYQKAPGSERENDIYKKAQWSSHEDQAFEVLEKCRKEEQENLFRKQWIEIDADPNLDPLEKSNRKHSLYLANNAFQSSSPMVSLSGVNSSAYHINSINNLPVTTVSPLAPPFYPTSDTVESVVGNALEDLMLDEPLNVAASIDRDYENDLNALNNPLSSCLTNSVKQNHLSWSNCRPENGLICASAPVNIPGSSFQDRSSSLLNNQSPSSTSPAFNSYLHSNLHRENSLDHSTNFMRATNGSLSNSNHHSNNLADTGLFSLSSMSPHNPLIGGLSQSPLVASLSGSLDLTSKINNQHQKELEDIRSGRARLGLSYIQALSGHTDWEKMPLHVLKAIQTQLKQDLNSVEKIINKYEIKNDGWSTHVPTW